MTLWMKVPAPAAVTVLSGGTKGRKVLVGGEWRQVRKEWVVEI